MSLSNELISYAKTLFDVAGLYSLSENESTLLLGMESTPQRNLDFFQNPENRFHITGFAEHIWPGLEKIITWLRERDVAARAIGQYGYVSEDGPDFINYKSLAIKAGLGKRGKNSLVINDDYGTRLRFAVIRIGVSLEPSNENPDIESPVCQSCSICIDECPVYILEPCRMTDLVKCLSNISGSSPVVENNEIVLCDICVKKCPANRIGLSD